MAEVDPSKSLAKAERPPVVASITSGKSVPTYWSNGDPAWIKAYKRAQRIAKMQHGLLIHVPMICRGKECPFAQSCYLRPQDRIVGARCPIEAATVVELYQRYAEQVGIDLEYVDLKTQAVDLSLVQELVELDIRIARGLQKLAINADFVQDVVTAIGNEGEVYTEAKLRPEVEYVNQLRKERHRILDLLLATRKARKQSGLGKDPSRMAAWLMQQARQMKWVGQGQAPDTAGALHEGRAEESSDEA